MPIDRAGETAPTAVFWLIDSDGTLYSSADLRPFHNANRRLAGGRAGSGRVVSVDGLPLRRPFFRAFAGGSLPREDRVGGLLLRERGDEGVAFVLPKGIDGFGGSERLLRCKGHVRMLCQRRGQM